MDAANVVFNEKEVLETLNSVFEAKFISVFIKGEVLYALEDNGKEPFIITVDEAVKQGLLKEVNT
jgi:hypothetical protein